MWVVLKEEFESNQDLSGRFDIHSVHLFVISVLLQFPNTSLLLAACAACIGGTFQYGYNISVINAPTTVITLLSILNHLIYG